MCTFGQVVVSHRIHFSKSACWVFTSWLLQDRRCCHHPPARGQTWGNILTEVNIRFYSTLPLEWVRIRTLHRDQSDSAKNQLVSGHKSSRYHRDGTELQLWSGRDKECIMCICYSLLKTQTHIDSCVGKKMTHHSVEHKYISKAKPTLRHLAKII